METVVYLCILLASIALIWRAGDIFVDSACEIARGLGISRAVVGLTLVSFATTAPEFATSTIATATGSVGMAYGNAVGSVITNMGLILALATILSTIKIEKGSSKWGGTMLGLGIMAVFMTLDFELARIEASLLFLVTLLFLLVVSVKNSGGGGGREKVYLPKVFSLFVLGAAGVVVGSRLLVFSGVELASSLGVSEAVIGFTLIAFGTSVPELTTALISVSKKVPELSLGNILGANIMDLGWVLGVAGIISPLTVESNTLAFGNSVMLLAMVILLVSLTRNKRLGRLTGCMLLGLYGIYLLGMIIL